MKYPVRARIIDAAGEPIPFPAPLGIVCATPAASLPHIGKEGLAELVRGLVRITLDDGGIIWGHDCWWQPLAQAKRRLTRPASRARVNTPKGRPMKWIAVAVLALAGCSSPSTRDFPGACGETAP